MDDVQARVRLRPDTETYEVAISQRGRNPIRKGYGKGEEARERAEAVAAEINARGARGARFDALSAASPLPTDDVLRDWLVARRETLSHSYEQTARGLVENHLAPFFGARDIRSIRERDVLAFMTHVVTSGGQRRVVDPKTGAATVERYGLSVSVAEGAVSALRRVVNLLVRDGVLDGNQLGDLNGLMRRMRKRHARGGKRRDAWTHDEAVRILELARVHEPWIYPVLVFLLFTGARRGEALGLKWDSVDFESGRILIRDARVRGRETTPKSDRERVAPMDVAGPRLRAVLEELAATRRTREPWQPPDLVFLSPTGHAIDERNFSRAWDRLRARFTDQTIRPLVVHCFRHTFVSMALAAGFTLLEVGQWVGHSQTRMTELYGHLVRGRGQAGFIEAPAPRALRAVEES
jgi:integrase